MNTFFFRISVFSVSLFSLKAFSAAEEFSQKFRDQTPFFYAAIASAAYKHHASDAQAFLDKKLGIGKAQVLQTVSYKQSLYGKTNMILIKDDNDRLHVGFEGSTDFGNWLRNLKSSVVDVEKDVLKGMHKIITDWEAWRPENTLTSVVGHSQGGMYASQVVRKFHAHYTQPRKTKSGKIDRSKRQGRATAITFNAYKPKKAPYQFHFATKNENGSTLFSSKGRYIPIKKGNNPASVKSNHTMKYVLRGLKNKSWENFKKYNHFIK